MEGIQVVKLQLIREKTLEYAAEQLRSPQEVAKVVAKFLNDPDRETLITICLNTKNHITAINIVSIGTLDGSLAHPREIYKAAIIANASSIIMAHNHPSGDCTPSNNDQKITKRIANAGEILGIPLLDHIIVGYPKNYFSFREGNLM